MEPWVLEVFGPDLPGDESLPQSVRVERTPGRTLLFSADLEDLKALRNRLPAGEYFLRQSNLEDLFLRTTGRKLHG
jgi:hypothetical protein